MEYFSLLLKPGKLNIYDLNYIYSSKIFDRFLQASDRALPNKGVFLRFLVFFKHMFEEINFRNWASERKIKENAYLIYSQSKNQRDSLLPLAEKLDNSYLFGKTGQYSFSLTTYLGYLYSIPFIFKIISEYIKSDGKKRLSFAYNLDRYWFTYGFYYAARKWLRKKKPIALILANDHVVEPRVLLKAAKDENISTVYIQHASVTDEFPVLQFDYAFLEGHDAVNMYAKVGHTDTRIYLIGSPKFDHFYKDINKKGRLETLGVCSNALDPVKNVENLLGEIRTSFPELKIYLRPHPSEKIMDQWQEIAEKNKVIFSDSRIEHSYDFLSKMDCIIAGNSNIHLEAALLNIIPLYYDFSQSDNKGTYSYVSRGLCEYLSEKNEIIRRIDSLIHAKPPIRDRAKYYIDSVNTIFDGRSSELVVSLLKDIFGESPQQKYTWYPIIHNQIKAYSLSVEENNEEK